MKVKSNAPSNLEMFIQQALILTLTSNMSQTKLMHNVFIVEKMSIFFSFECCLAVIKVSI